MDEGHPPTFLFPSPVWGEGKDCTIPAIRLFFLNLGRKGGTFPQILRCIAFGGMERVNMGRGRIRQGGQVTERKR